MLITLKIASFMNKSSLWIALLCDLGEIAGMCQHTIEEAAASFEGRTANTGILAKLGTAKFETTIAINNSVKCQSRVEDSVLYACFFKLCGERQHCCVLSQWLCICILQVFQSEQQCCFHLIAKNDWISTQRNCLTF